MNIENPSFIKVSYQLDASWQLCPVPILMTEEKLADMAAGEILEVIFTDRGAKADLEAWCRSTGNACLGFRDEKIKSSAYVRKEKT